MVGGGDIGYFLEMKYFVFGILVGITNVVAG